MLCFLAVYMAREEDITPTDEAATGELNLVMSPHRKALEQRLMLSRQQSRLELKVCLLKMCDGRTKVSQGPSLPPPMNLLATLGGGTSASGLGLCDVLRRIGEKTEQKRRKYHSLTTGRLIFSWNLRFVC